MAAMPAVAPSSTDFSSADLVTDLSTGVDLSSVGLPPAVPVYALIGVGLVAPAIFRR